MASALRIAFETNDSAGALVALTRRIEIFMKLYKPIDFAGTEFRHGWSWEGRSLIINRLAECFVNKEFRPWQSIGVKNSICGPNKKEFRRIDIACERKRFWKLVKVGSNWSKWVNSFILKKEGCFIGLYKGKFILFDKKTFDAASLLYWQIGYNRYVRDSEKVCCTLPYYKDIIIADKQTVRKWHSLQKQQQKIKKPRYCNRKDYLIRQAINRAG